MVAGSTKRCLCVTVYGPEPFLERFDPFLNVGVTVRKTEQKDENKKRDMLKLSVDVQTFSVSRSVAYVQRLNSKINCCYIKIPIAKN